MDTATSPIPFQPGRSAAGEGQNPAKLQEEAKTFVSGEGGSKFKIILSILLIFVLLGAIGAVVYKFILPKLSKPENVVLTYWGLWEENNIVGAIIADYEKTHPNVKVTYERQSPRDYRERLQSALAREEGPDIFRFHNTWVPMFKSDLASIPTTVYDAASFEATFYPVARNDLRLGNSYVGIPLEIDGLGLFINTDLFKAAAKQAPKTWDELRKTALELTVRDSSGQIQIAGVALGRTENVDHWSDILALMMFQNGADLAEPGKCYSQTSSAGDTGETCLGADALTYFTIFSQVDGVWDKTLPASTLAFSGGKLAMYFGPSWEVFEIKRLNSNLNFEVVPVPQLPDTNIAFASYWVEGVSKKSKKQEAAWDFLKYLSTREVLQKFYQDSSKTRLFGEPYGRVDMASILENQPYVGVYIKSAPTARSWYLASKTYDNGINDKLISYYANAVNAVNSGKTSKEALAVTSQGVSQILSQYGLASPVAR
ncbi:MAG: extracellular solute-binding protein [bacterium]|nr:extracellular solute-binding protein [bacterium]